jgi:hypothetical protein
VYSHDHAACAKLAIGPLWDEILGNLRRSIPAARRQPSEIDGSGPTDSPKLLAYYSGHDSTISLLLSSLGSKVWELTDAVPYASLMVLEVYHVTDDAGGDDGEAAEDEDDGGDTVDYDDDENRNSPTRWSESFKFRLLFNGRVLTPQIKHCREELCDLRILVDRLEEFATHERNCRPKRTKSEKEKSENSALGEDDGTPTEDESPDAIPISPSPPWTGLLGSVWWKAMVSALFGVCVGSFATWTYMLHCSSLRPNWPVD